MKQGRSRWTRLACVGWMALGLALTAQGAKDEFLTLGPPIFTGNKVQFTITGEADAVYVIESSEEGLFWSPRITNYDKTITRFVSLDRSPHAEYYRGWRRRLPVFSAAITARTSIDFSGNNLTVDSFDSTDPNHSTAGRYDPTKANAGGDVATIDGWVNVGNAGFMARSGRVSRAPSPSGQTAMPGPSAGMARDFSRPTGTEEISDS